jgi:excisionase family DNA binding protein
VPGSPERRTGSQPVVNITLGGAGGVQPSQPFAGFPKGFVTPLVTGGRGKAGHLRSLPEEAETLLTVREVAGRLRVSTATVYKLCARGELRSVRVLNALRISKSDLAALAGGAARGGF